MIEIETRHGDTLLHRHEGYDYWHPAARVHSIDNTPDEGLPIGHILANVVPYTEEEPEPRGLQVKPFDWIAWDEGCEAKGLCQGFHSIEVADPTTETTPCVWEGFRGEYSDGLPVRGVFEEKELRHRPISRDCIGLVEPYWQCPHCRQLQNPIQWIQDARLETYQVEVRGTRRLVWAQVSSGQWFILVINAHGTLQGVARGVCHGTVYVVGDKPPVQLPDECSFILARRMWYRLTRGYWSDRKKEEDC